MRSPLVKRAILMVLALAACCGAAWALGEETFGNAPLTDANYKDWPGIMPVVNHPSRVYHVWVNGNEHFYYRGDTAALNDTLRKFAEARSEVREVVLRPGPGEARSFDQTQKIPFGWKLHLIGGIARHVTTLEGGTKVWSPHPRLAVYVGGEVDLEKIEIPKGLTVAPLSQLKQSNRESLKSGDKTVRGWGAGELVALDPYDAESREAVMALLKDPDNWVRLNAVGVLPRFGKAAQPALPTLREFLQGEDAPLKAAAQKSIQEIEGAEDRAAAAREHQAMLQRIERFLARRKE